MRIGAADTDMAHAVADLLLPEADTEEADMDTEADMEADTGADTDIVEDISDKAE